MDGTDAFEATLALIESEERFRAVCDTAPVVIWVSDPPDVAYANQAMVAFSGYSREEMYTPGFFANLVHPDDRAMVVERGRARVAGEVLPNRYEFRAVTKSGEVRWLDLSASTVVYGGKRHGVYVAADITERKQMERDLVASEERYRTTFESIHDVYYQTDPSGRILMMSPSATRHTGFTPEELTGTLASSVWASAADYDRFIQQLVTAGSVNDFEARLRRKDGSAVWTSVNGSFVRDGTGTVTGIQGTLRDIGERKHAVDALRASEERYRTMLDATSEGVCLTDLDQHITYVNAALMTMLDLPAGELRGRSVSEFVVAGQLLPVDKQPWRQGKRFSGEVRLLRTDGAVVHTFASIAPYRDETGEICGMLAMVNDITERKRAEEERDRIFTSSLDMIAVMTATGRFQRLNPAWERTLGYGEDMVGQSVWHFAHPDDRAESIEISRRANEGIDIHDMRARMRHVDGTYRWTSWNVGKVTDGGLSYVVVRDITEQVRDDTEREEILEAVKAQTICLGEQAEELDRLRIEAEFIARHDGLTGCLNRRAWFEWAADGRPTAIAIFDIDFFKRVNDSYGHPAGDFVLREVAHRLMRLFDGEAILGRLGGEEFAVLFEKDWSDAMVLAAEAVELMASRPIVMQDGLSLDVTVSAGLAKWVPGVHSREESIALTYEAADRALYEAKQTGRRRMCIEDEAQQAAA